jgi:hypothetical protein
VPRLGSVTPTGSIYLKPVAPLGGALTACPSLTGLRPFSSSAKKVADRSVLAYARVSLSADLAHSDRSWWPDVRRNWASSSPAASKRATVLAAAPATTSAFRSIVTRSCGSTVVNLSWSVVAGPSQKANGPHCEACNVTYFLVNRLGHPLVYFAY